jgi:hypothetical protein
MGGATDAAKERGKTGFTGGQLLHELSAAACGQGRPCIRFLPADTIDNARMETLIHGPQAASLQRPDLLTVTGSGLKSVSPPPSSRT